MKKFLTVFEFEFMSYVKNKSFVAMTIILTVLLGAATFLPRIFDMSEILGTRAEKKEEKEDGEKVTLGIVDEKGYFADLSVLEQAFGNAEFIVFDSEEELKQVIKAGEETENMEASENAIEDEAENQDIDNEVKSIEAGFYVMDDLHYRYYVLNRDMSDVNTALFNEVLEMVHKQLYCAKHGMDYATFTAEYEMPVTVEEEILGKDASMNFWYCYALVIIIFMVIILYGVMIATSVTTEKSNRSIEVLVTSIDSKYLLFGKVFAGATAAVIQLGMILGAALIGYSINRDAWGNKLDLLLDIPAEVLVCFAVFGIGGFLFYAFLYGAVGALVSKTEDINQTAGSLQMIIMIVYFIVLFQLENTEGILMKVCSFLPVSSYSAMFVRLGMGQVATWEVVVSAIILYASIIATGWLAARIYRMGTLRYGNPIKIHKALKDVF